MVVTAMYTKVLRVTCQNTASWASVTKLASPTNAPDLGHRPVLQAQEDAVEERIGDEREQEEDARRQHEPAEHPLPLEDAAQREVAGARPGPVARAAPAGPPSS